MESKISTPKQREIQNKDQTSNTVESKQTENMIQKK